MKKVILIMAICAMAAPLLAADPITITVSADDIDDGNAVLTIGYSGASGSPPYGISMVVDLNNDAAGDGSAEVQGPDDFGTVDSFFDVFIDLAFEEPNDYLDPVKVDPCTGIWEPGQGAPHPFADDSAAGVPTFPAQVFSMCMGELAQTGSIGSSGTLAVVTIHKVAGAGAETGCTVHIAADSLRGTIVDPNGDPMDVTYPGDLEVDWETGECYVIDHPRYYDENGLPGPNITQANYDAWTAAGKPLCWCCPHHGYGDVNGDGWINANDYSPVQGNQGTQVPPAPARADVNHDGWVNANDYSPIQASQGVQMTTSCPDCP